jgi:hypothetical protein
MVLLFRFSVKLLSVSIIYRIIIYRIIEEATKNRLKKTKVVIGASSVYQMQKSMEKNKTQNTKK